MSAGLLFDMGGHPHAAQRDAAAMHVEAVVAKRLAVIAQHDEQRPVRHLQLLQPRVDRRQQVVAAADGSVVGGAKRLVGVQRTVAR